MSFQGAFQVAIIQHGDKYFLQIVTGPREGKYVCYGMTDYRMFWQCPIKAKEWAIATGYEVLRGVTLGE